MFQKLQMLNEKLAESRNKSTRTELENAYLREKLNAQTEELNEKDFQVKHYEGVLAGRGFSLVTNTPSNRSAANPSLEPPQESNSRSAIAMDRQHHLQLNSVLAQY